MQNDETLRQQLEKMAGRKCLPEGELHVCWLVEQKIKAKYNPVLSSPQEWDSYTWALIRICSGQEQWNDGKYVGNMKDLMSLISATWQQRAEALRKVLNHTDKITK